MIKSRNLSIHIYDEKTAESIAKIVISDYYKLFQNFEQKMIEKIDDKS